MEVPADAGTEPTLLPLKILLVEDSPDIRTITLAYLSDTPYRVEIAENGAVAYEKFIAGAFDLVLMDRQMPVMDGLAATRAIRVWERENNKAATPIIALTASALKGDQDRCIAAGSTAYLTKPIKQEVLLQAVKSFSIDAKQRTSSAGSGSLDVIRVRVDPRYADLAPRFLESCRDDVASIRAALARNEFERIGDLGHGMRGAGSSFGFDAITNFGATLEDAAKILDLAALANGVDELESYLDRLEVLT